jgi:hypothetical protein
MCLTKTVLFLLLFVSSVGNAGENLAKTAEFLETSAEIKPSSTSSPEQEIQGQQIKIDSEKRAEKKRVTWADVSDSEKQPSPKRQKISDEEVFFSDKERTFETHIAFIQDEIMKAHEQVNPERIRRAHRKIYTLEYPEAVWEGYARALTMYRWPSQKSWRDVVAGHLFFPRETFEWEVVPSEEYRLRRTDNLWAYAAAAKSNHAVGKFYLIYVLEKVREIDHDYGDNMVFFDNQCKEVFEELRRCEDNPDACYVIGGNYHMMPNRSSKFVEEILGWHTKGGDLKNRYRILLRKKRCDSLYGPVTRDDFLALGRAGFSPAYQEAIELTKSIEREPIIQEYVHTGFKPALLRLARYYITEF